MMSNLKREEQSKIYAEIVEALIDSTPEHWYSFCLNISEGQSGLIHSIESNEKHPELVSPNDELYASTRKLQLYQIAINEPINAGQFKVYLDDSDQWKYEAFFDYKII